MVNIYIFRRNKLRLDDLDLPCLKKVSILKNSFMMLLAHSSLDDAG